MCANISQIGLPVVLCGCATPQQFEHQPERALFTDIHYIAIVCDEEALLHRMRDGRKVTDEKWIESSRQFNRWLKENAGKTEPQMALLDITGMEPQEAAGRLDSWIMDKIKNAQFGERTI